MKGWYHPKTLSDVHIYVILFIAGPEVCNEPQVHCVHEVIDSDDEVWDRPLATTALLAESPSLSLKRFVCGAVNKFGEELDVSVNRDKDILQQVVRKYTHLEFDITKSLNVSFVNELGVDAGGLTREYFYLVMHHLQMSNASLGFFEGCKGHLLPVHNYDFVSGGLFVIIGKMILHSVLNNCTGVPGLSPTVIAYVTSGNRDAAVEHITLEDIPDPVLQDKLHQLVNCKEEELYQFTDSSSSLDISENLISAGSPHLTITGNRTNLAYECCVTYEVLTKRLASLDDIRKGLSSVHVVGQTLLDLLTKWFELKQRVFPALGSEVINAAERRSCLLLKGESDPENKEARQFFEKYVDELNAREGVVLI